jgi:putative copper resistance protein D
LLVELTHIPMGLFGIAAGWARWLEITLPPRERSIPGWTWRLCFVFVGLLLLGYREI